MSQKDLMLAIDQGNIEEALSLIKK